MVVARLGAQHAVDALEAARRELVVVALVAGRGPREHDVVAVLAARRAVPVVFRVVLRENERASREAEGEGRSKNNLKNGARYRRAEVVADLVGERHVRDGGRHVFAVVEQGHDARVEALQAAPVVLRRYAN